MGGSVEEVVERRGKKSSTNSSATTTTTTTTTNVMFAPPVKSTTRRRTPPPTATIDRLSSGGEPTSGDDEGGLFHGGDGSRRADRRSQSGGEDDTSESGGTSSANSGLSGVEGESLTLDGFSTSATSSMHHKKSSKDKKKDKKSLKRKERKRLKKEEKRRRRERKEKKRKAAEKDGGSKKRKKEYNGEDNDDDDERMEDANSHSSFVSGIKEGGDDRDSEGDLAEQRHRSHKRKGYELATREEFDKYKSEWLERIPKDVKLRFREGGFSKWGNDWLPVLELGPFDVEPGPVRDMWFDMFRKTMQKGRDMTRLVFRYGVKFEDRGQAYSCLPESKIVHYEEGERLEYCNMPKKIQQKVEKKTKLTKTEEQIRRGLTEIVADMKRNKSDRIEWMMNWTEDFEYAEEEAEIQAKLAHFVEEEDGHMDFTAYSADDETIATPLDGSSSSTRKRAFDGDNNIESSSVGVTAGGILKSEENNESPVGGIINNVDNNNKIRDVTDATRINDTNYIGEEVGRGGEDVTTLPSTIGGKRKRGRQPQHLVPGVVGQGDETTQVILSKRYNGHNDESMISSDAAAAASGNNDDGQHDNDEDDGENSNDVESKSNDSNDNDSISTETERRDDLIDSLSNDQMALLSTLIQMEDGIRAHLSQLQDNNNNNIPHYVVPPPSFPNEMANYLLSDTCKSIVVLAGAGMSVSCGIPDFRSAGIGLYDTLRPELLTATDIERMCIVNDPTLALDKGLFLQNPLPMLETKRSFILGTHEKRWKATLTHRFVELLHTKLPGKLTRVYTQNIDGLEYQTSLPREKVVAVHGSMGAAACEVCGQTMDFDTFTEAIRTNIKDITNEDINAPRVSTPILCLTCNEPTVKPTIVLFRGSMPQEFHTRIVEDMPHVDLLIIIGTSLTVAPANSIVYRIPPTAIRLVMNDEPVGRRLGIDYNSDSAKRDVWAKGKTDKSCLDLAEKLGWLDDLALIVNDLPDSSAVLLRERLASAAMRRQDDERCVF